MQKQNFRIWKKAEIEIRMAKFDERRIIEAGISSLGGRTTRD